MAWVGAPRKDILCAVCRLLLSGGDPPQDLEDGELPRF